MWTKPLYHDHLHCIANFCANVLKISSKQIISNDTKILSLYQTLKGTGEMKLMMKFFLCLHNFSELNLLKLIFSSFNGKFVVVLSQAVASLAVASWLVRSTPELALRVRALAGDIVLCSWTRHFTLKVPVSTQVYKLVPANLILGVTLRWTSISSRGK